MGGATIIPHSLKTKLNPKNFQDRSNLFFLIIYVPLKFAYNRFSNIRSINCGRIWLYVSILGQNVKIYSPKSQTRV
jgi:hypothetical protein